MTKLHLDELNQKLGGRGLYWLPDEAIKAMPEKWILLENNILYLPNDEVPSWLTEAMPVLEHDSHLYVFGRTDVTGFAVKYGEERVGMPDPKPLLQGYVDSSTVDMQNLGSCLGNLCELSFGVTTSHPDYRLEHATKFFEDIKRLHGEAAAGTLQSAADAIGYSVDDGLGEFSAQNHITWMLQLAQVQSDWHRGYRTLGR